MKRQPIQIDRAKLRLAARKLRNASVFYMSDDAIELLPPPKLLKMVKKYLDVEQLRPDAEPTMPRKLLTDAQRVRKARRLPAGRLRRNRRLRGIVESPQEQEAS